ncbi:MAG: signal peptide peptidase SppA [Planctomycetes bacterium]|nr:signal peptide peptidase SppA [Planctomycetota bacterium]
MSDIPATPKRPLSFWLAIILGVLLVISAVINLVLLVALAGSIVPTAASDQKHYREKAIGGDAFSANKVLVIPIKGVIMSTDSDASIWGVRHDPVESVVDALEKARADRLVKAIILDVNSPGGGITACHRIHTALKRFKQSRPEVPIISSMAEVSASGGYYVSTPAHRIIAQPTTITGSIGVIANFLNIEGLFHKIGLKSEVIKSADKKDIGSGTRPMTEEERKILQDLIDEMYQRFINVVVEGRNNLTREKIIELADGRIYTGEQALKNGLVDELGDREDAFRIAKEKAGITSARLVEYQKQIGFWEIFGARNNYPLMDIQKIIMEKDTPNFLYLWRVD